MGSMALATRTARRVDRAGFSFHLAGDATMSAKMCTVKTAFPARKCLAGFFQLFFPISPFQAEDLAFQMVGAGPKIVCGHQSRDLRQDGNG